MPTTTRCQPTGSDESSREGDYASVLRWIESNGVRDEHGGYSVIDAPFFMSTLCYMESSPDERTGGTVFRFPEPAEGTAAFQADLALRLSNRSWTKGQCRRYFPPEAMRHLRLAGGTVEPVASSTGDRSESDSAAFPDAWLGAGDIARRFDVDPESLRARLRRMQHKDHTCFKELQPGESGPREPRILYRLSAVMPTVEALQKASSERTAKKK